MKFTATLAFFASVASFGSATNLRATTLQNAGKRGLIIDGATAGDGIVGSFVFFSNGNCAGSLIDSDRVLTTASCVYGENANGAPESVFIGATSRFNLTTDDTLYIEEVEVLCAQTHPDWPIPAEGENITYMGPDDLAIVKLARNATCVEDATCEVIEYLSMPQMEGPTTDSVQLFGIGQFQEGDPEDPDNYPRATLRTAQSLAILPDQNCIDDYGDEKLDNTTKFICVGSDGENSARGHCTGDYGGPGINSDGILIGVMIDIDGNCSTNTLDTVLSDTGYYSDWIDSQRRSGGDDATMPMCNVVTEDTTEDGGCCCSRAYVAVKKAAAAAFGYLFG